VRITKYRAIVGLAVIALARVAASGIAAPQVGAQGEHSSASTYAPLVAVASLANQQTIKRYERAASVRLQHSRAIPFANGVVYVTHFRPDGPSFKTHIINPFVVSLKPGEVLDTRTKRKDLNNSRYLFGVVTYGQAFFNQYTPQSMHFIPSRKSGHLIELVKYPTERGCVDWSSPQSPTGGPYRGPIAETVFRGERVGTNPPPCSPTVTLVGAPTAPGACQDFIQDVPGAVFSWHIVEHADVSCKDARQTIELFFAPNTARVPEQGVCGRFVAL
jgi:hypothetical protein